MCTLRQNLLAMNMTKEARAYYFTPMDGRPDYYMCICGKPRNQAKDTQIRINIRDAHVNWKTEILSRQTTVTGKYILLQVSFVNFWQC